MIERAVDAAWADAPGEPDHAPRLRLQPDERSGARMRERAAGWCHVHGVEQWAAAAGYNDALRTGCRTPTSVRARRRRHVPARCSGRGRRRRPLLGVNLGKIGFLSRSRRTSSKAVLARIGEGRYRLEERRCSRGGSTPWRRRDQERMIALNDIVVARGALARVCRLDVSIDDSHLATFIADGLVVASPTGSTGYSFSAGGPIVDPQSRNLIVTPIAGYRPPSGRLSPDRPRRSAAASSTRTKHSSRSTDARTSRSPSATWWRSGRWTGRSGSSSRRDGPVLGPPPAQGRAPAVVTRPDDRSVTAGRLLELTVTDLALIDRLRLELGPGLNVITGETGAGKSCSSTRSASPWARAPTPRWSGTGLRSPGSRRSSTGSPSRSSRSARSLPPAGRRLGSTTRP